MLTKIFGKKCDHPLVDVKAAQALLEGLPRNDTLKFTVELTEWIESVANHAEFRLADQFAVLSLLDETVQVYARKLAYEFFSLADMHTFQGNRLCQVLGNLFYQTADAYCMLFGRYSKGDKGGDSIHAPLLVARAIRAIRQQLKYSAVRYEASDRTIWRNLAQFYRHAEQQQYLDIPVSLYPAMPEPVSVRSEWAQLMAWYACGMNSMKPRNMHLAERIIAHYGKTVVLSDCLSAQTILGFDLQHPHEPVRFGLEVGVHPSMRYISIADMQNELEALIRILEKDIVPQELDLDGVFAAGWVMEAAQHVLAYLVEPPTRQSSRREFKALLNVVLGCEKVFACSAGQENGGQMQVSLENASASGFLAILSGKGIDGVRIGHLLGMQAAGQARLGVAIVRRLSRDAEGCLHVGAKVLSHQAVPVNLSQGAEGGDEQRALWLNANLEKGTVSLLMQADRFSLQRSLKTHFEGRNYLLIPVELQEKGPDYDLAGFRAIEQEGVENQD